MNLLDITIILIVGLQVVKWSRIGLINGLFPLVGFWLGLFAGLLLAQQAVSIAPNPASRLLIVLGIVILLAFIGAALGRYLARHMAFLSEKLKLQPVDTVLGAVFSATVTLLVIWLFAPIFSGTTWQNLNSQVRNSAILQAVDEALPPAPAALSRIANLISPYDFPQVFTGIEPRPIEPVDLPDSAEIQAAVAAAGQATVRLESIGCGGLVNGSGFVAAPGLVVTNAHVVAGISRPTVVDQNGYHRARTIHFDPDLDIAILRVPSITTAPLPLINELLPRGASGVTLGYPGGGPLTAEPAGVLRQIDATGRDIYGRKIVTRSVYELQTRVESGNSGGPVVSADGAVIGVVFARSESVPDIGYSLVSTQLITLLNQVRTSDAPVDTGHCLR